MKILKKADYNVNDGADISKGIIGCLCIDLCWINCNKCLVVGLPSQ